MQPFYFYTSSFLILHLPPEMPSSVELLATPDYPVAAGQRVSLHCSASYSPASTVWIWERHENQTWQEVGSGTDLILTEPEQSGEYRCRAMRSIFVTSNSHTVYIVSMHATGWWFVVISCISE